MITIQTIIASESIPEANNPLDRVTIEDGSINVANRDDPNIPRYAVGDYVIAIGPDWLLPENILRHNHLWDDGKNKGFLKGSKGNRTGIFRIVGVPSEVMLIKLSCDDVGFFIPDLNIRISEDVAESIGAKKWENPNK